MTQEVWTWSAHSPRCRQAHKYTVDQEGLESALTREEEYAGFMGLGQDFVGSQLGDQNQDQGAGWSPGSTIGLVILDLGGGVFSDRQHCLLEEYNDRKTVLGMITAG